MLLIYCITFFISILLMKYNMNIIASVLMMTLAIFLYLCDVKKTKNILNLRGLFSLGFLFPYGMSLLKLSNLSNDYSLKTYLTIFTTYFSIYLGYEFASWHENTHKKDDNKTEKIIEINYSFNEKFIYRTLVSFMMISFICFIIEAIKLKFIPILIMNTPHAYSTFHIFMLHYFTTLYILIPAISMIYMYIKIKQNQFDTIIKLRVICAILFSITMSILLVSRAQLISSIINLLFMFIILFVQDIKKYINFFVSHIKKNIEIVVVASIFIFVLLLLITIRRSHSVEYLNSIFDMKNKNIPIFITQPYMYFTQGFENLNYMINNLQQHSYGIKIFMPIWTLSFIKLFFPAHIQFENYIIKEELTNTTIIYDLFVDFGFIGIIIVSILIGILFYKLQQNLSKENNNPFFYILYIMTANYTILSFFQPFFSLTITWTYYLVIIILYYLYNILNIEKDE